MQHSSVKRLFRDRVQDYSNKDQYKRSPLLPLVLRWLKKKKTNKKIKICEFGGGAGQLLNEIRRSYLNDAELTNVEIVNDYKKYLASNEIKFVLGSVLKPTFTDNAFDIIIMRDVLHHLVGKNYQETLDNQELALTELKRLVKSGGVIFIEELTNESVIGTRLMYHLSKLHSEFLAYASLFNISKYTVVAFFTPKKLNNLCTKIFGKEKVTIKSHYKPRKAFRFSKILHFGAKTPKLIIIAEK